MDDFDSFSTVVQKDAPPQKDDFDSFSTVVGAPNRAVAAPVRKKGLLERAGAKMDEGWGNLKREFREDPVKATRDGALGIGKGLMDTIDGGAQLLARGMENGAESIAPGSAMAKWLKGERVKVEDINKKREDLYQEATKGSVMAGTGRVAGNVALPVANGLKVAKGASMLKKVGMGAATGATYGAFQPVYDVAGKTGEDDDYASQKLTQVGVGTLLGGVAPVATKGVLEGASKLGSKKAEQILTDERAAQLFNKSKNAKADAEVITELGGVNSRIGERKILTNEVNARSKKVMDEAQTALRAAGASEKELLAFRNWQGLTESERAAMAGTPTGKAAAAIIEKLDRFRGLTPGELSTRNASVVRSALDMLPIPSVLRHGLRTTLGGKQTRAEAAEKFLDPRSQRAAAQYLERNGPSEATQGLQDLQAIAQSKVDAAAALERAKAAAKAKAAADRLANAGTQKALTTKARQISGTPGGGAYQALLEHTGLAADDLNKVLRAAQKIPEAADAVRAVRVAGGNTKEGAIYPVTDIVNAIANKMGMPRGALSPTAQSAGILTDVVEPLTAKYQMATKVRQKIYDGIHDAADKLGSAQAREAVKQLARKLKSTPKSTERVQMIDDLEKSYPEAAGMFDAARNFK
jgi:hypothetical protein